MRTEPFSLQGDEKLVQAVIRGWKSEKPYLKNKTGQVCCVPTPLTIPLHFQWGEVPFPLDSLPPVSLSPILSPHQLPFIYSLN